jgi:hypothetical protein
MYQLIRMQEARSGTVPAARCRSYGDFGQVMASNTRLTFRRSMLRSRAMARWL